jgi:hypothetical protein
MKPSLSPDQMLVDRLTDNEIFSLLKRIYTDFYRQELIGSDAEKLIFLETILTLEKLYKCLVEVEDFIGYSKVDWDEACQTNDAIKKASIICFYNNLLIDTNLVRVLNICYTCHFKVGAFIEFVSSDKLSLFRQELQTNEWDECSFPFNDVFQSIDDFRKYLKNRRINLAASFEDEVNEVAKEIQNSIKHLRKINHALVSYKFNIVSKGEAESGKIYNSLLDELSIFNVGRGLPWVAKILKAELELKDQVRITVGFFFDSSRYCPHIRDISKYLNNEILELLYQKNLAQNITVQITCLDQIFACFGIKFKGEVRLSNNKKVQQLLKWYLGAMFDVNRIIKPVNFSKETVFFNNPNQLLVNHPYLSTIKNGVDNIVEKNKKKNKQYSAEQIKNKLNQNYGKLLQKAPTYISSIHKFYEDIRAVQCLTVDQIEILQVFNLFIYHLDIACLENLTDRLISDQNQMAWPYVVQMYCLFLMCLVRNLDCLENWAISDITGIDSILSKTRIKNILADGQFSERRIRDIESDLIALQYIVKNDHKLKNIKKSVNLIKKNSLSALRYLEHSFKKNAVVMRFNVNNQICGLELSTLKELFTQYIKAIGRAPRLIGGHLDAYIGYCFLQHENYSIDFTLIIYIGDSVQLRSIQASLIEYWKNFIHKYEKSKKLNFDDLLLVAIPVIGCNHCVSNFKALNQGDKLIDKFKKDLVNFYTAYEYFNDYKNVGSGKRPELFLRGRIRKSVSKGKKQVRHKKSQLEKETPEFVQKELDGSMNINIVTNGFVEKGVVKDTLEEERQLQDHKGEIKPKDKGSDNKPSQKAIVVRRNSGVYLKKN